jgi:hypothetical protein
MAEHAGKDPLEPPVHGLQEAHGLTMAAMGVEQRRHGHLSGWPRMNPDISSS